MKTMMKKSIRRFLLCLSVVSVVACLVSCKSSQQSASDSAGSPNNSSTADGAANASQPEKIKVSVTFDALYEFAYAIGKDKADIVTIIPPGAEPHDFEPKAGDLIGLGNAQIFVYNGLGMESWVEEAVSAADNPGLIVVDASKGADSLVNTDPDEISEHGQYDPHLWLSLKGAALQANNIKEAFVTADPSNKDYYERNYADFADQLNALYDEYDGKFKSVAKTSFVTGHAAFGYLCRDFGLEQNSVEDTFADGEPTAQQLSDLIEYCKANDVSVIFAEDMASPDVSQTLANEVGARVETIHTIESAEDDNATYLQRMEDNLSKIYESLK